MHTSIRSHVLGIVALIVPSLAWAVDDPKQHASIQLFLKACAITYAHETQVANVMTELGFSEIAEAAADQYLVGRPGRAWRGMIDSNAYGVAIQPNGLCTVFVHAGDATQIQSAVESWLPPASSDITLKTEDLTTQPGLKTTAYELRGGKVQERWVVTISSGLTPPVRALLSWNRL